jgi:hypothetical protein
MHGHENTSMTRPRPHAYVCTLAMASSNDMNGITTSARTVGPRGLLRALARSAT